MAVMRTTAAEGRDRAVARSRRARGGACLAAAAFVVFVALAQADLAVPPLRGRVNDLAGLLPPGQAQALEQKLAAFEQETGHQIVVLTVRGSLDGEPIETFSLRVAEAWKIGQAKIDNGAVFVVVPADRKARIEVGYGLEGVVPDVIAARILRDDVIPLFLVGRMADGVEAGADKLMAAARGEVIPEDQRPWQHEPHTEDQDPVAGVLFAAALGGMIGGMVMRRHSAGSAAVAGLASGALGTFMVGTAIGVGIAALLGAFVGFTGMFAGGGSLGRGGRRGGGVFLPGGGGFGGGGGGGFGGGGGGFGGGGASGSW